MSFIRTVISLCSGVSVFLKLLNIPLWRTVLHTILMILVCSLIISVISWFYDKEKISVVSDRFFEQTGGVRLTGDSLEIPLDPETARHYILSQTFRFDYFPTPESVNFTAIEQAHQNSGIICVPAGCVLWTRGAAVPKYVYACIPAKKLFAALASPGYEKSLPEARELVDKFSSGNSAAVSGKTLEQEVIRFMEKHQEGVLARMQQQEKAEDPVQKNPVLIQEEQILPML